MDLCQYEAWFVTGSQGLYGQDALRQVGEDSRRIAEALDALGGLSVRVIFKPVATSPEGIRQLCREANAAEACIGLITWMHTFSPAKMWIAGLSELAKPFVHLHTQFNRRIPWSEIDMDFMNLNQSAHGGREFGYICTRLGLRRKVIVGHWQDETVQAQLDVWARAASAWQDAQGARVARFGDNMRQVAVTEGDKVEAQIALGYEVHGYGVGDLAAEVEGVADADVEALLGEYDATYDVAEPLRPDGKRRESLRQAARMELGMRRFLQEGDFKAFTTTFEDLHGLPQLPGLACQRLMADGYGFGAEGDWKTAALVRAMKVMASGRDGGTSFMEDYTYDFAPEGGRVLGAHMLEVCPSTAGGKPSLQIHALGIGGKDDPPRLVFDMPPGAGLNATLVDMGDRFRMILNEVDVIEPDAPLPKLPVARGLWIPRPDLATAAACWIYAGGAHHTGFSQAVTTEHLEDFAEMAGLELFVIDDRTRLRDFRRDARR